jgi:hypothetical protein
MRSSNRRLLISSLVWVALSGPPLSMGCTSLKNEHVRAMDGSAADAGMSSTDASGCDAEPASEEPRGDAAAGGEWYCTSSGSACVCIEDRGMVGDSCEQKPACCFTLEVFGRSSCQCWPEDSSSCRDQPGESPEARRIATCPPP